jgi:hypothetical protein
MYMMRRPDSQDEQIDLFCSEQIIADSKDNIKLIIGTPWMSLV